MDIEVLINRHFGYVAIPTSIGRVGNTVLQKDFDSPGDVVPIYNEAEIQSILGTPIFFPCRIGISPDNMLALPNEPLINISGSNRIIRTELTKLKGSVKERMQLSDYVISITGIIINEESEDYPAEMVSQIREICENGSCYVESDLLKVFNITKLAIESFKFPSRPTSQNEQDYSITAYSDYDIELIINEEDIANTGGDFVYSFNS